MLRMFPDLWTWCYCFCFRWSVLRKRPEDCRWHSPSSSTWSKIIQKKKFIKVKEITEQISSERIEIDFSSIHQWVHSFSVKFNFSIKDREYFVFVRKCLWDNCDTGWRKSPPGLGWHPLTPAQVTVPSDALHPCLNLYTVSYIIQATLKLLTTKTLFISIPSVISAMRSNISLRA